MSKKDKIIETIEVEDASLLPELLDGKHHVIPIVTGGDEVAEEVEVPEIIPILTLRSSVLFPGAITPITVGRDKSKAASWAPCCSARATSKTPRRTTCTRSAPQRASSKSSKCPTGTSR